MTVCTAVLRFTLSSPTSPLFLCVVLHLSLFPPYSSSLHPPSADNVNTSQMIVYVFSLRFYPLSYLDTLCGILSDRMPTRGPWRGHPGPINHVMGRLCQLGECQAFIKHHNQTAVPLPPAISTPSYTVDSNRGVQFTPRLINLLTPISFIASYLTNCKPISVAIQKNKRSQNVKTMCIPTTNKLARRYGILQDDF